MKNHCATRSYLHAHVSSQYCKRSVRRGIQSLALHVSGLIAVNELRSFVSVKFLRGWACRDLRYRLGITILDTEAPEEGFQSDTRHRHQCLDIKPQPCGWQSSIHYSR